SFGVALDAVSDFLAGGFHAFPTLYFYPLALFQILIVLEEVLDAGQLFGGQVVRALDVTVRRIQLVHRHGQQFGIAARLVVHVQDADGARTDHRAHLHREGSQHQHVHRIAVIGNGLRDIAVVAGIVHGRQHEAVDEDRAGVLVDFVLDRVRIHGNFDDDVEFFRQVGAGGYAP